MFRPTRAEVTAVKEHYPVGCRVELVYMNDEFNHKLTEGCRGTVRVVDDMGTIHVNWDCGSRLGVVFGEDYCKRVEV